MKGGSFDMPQTAKNVLQLVANGNYNHKPKDELKRRAKNEQKLKVSAEHMDPPSYLDPGAKKQFRAIIKLFVHTGYKMLENTDLKLSVFQHFFILVSY